LLRFDNHRVVEPVETTVLPRVVEPVETTVLPRGVEPVETTGPGWSSLSRPPICKAFAL